jgi:putative spermidine/putrescine transport system substrate-binding protein
MVYVLKGREEDKGDPLFRHLMRQRISRRRVLATAAGLAAAGAVGSVAQACAPAAPQTSGGAGTGGKRVFEGETLRVQFWAGGEGQNIRNNVVDPFVKKTGANVVVTDGVTSASIAKIRAEKASPSIDVALMDDIGILTTGREGLLEPIDLSTIPNAAQVDPRFFIEGKGIAFFVYSTAMAYNTDVIKEEPKSWKILWDPQYRITLPAPGLTPALQMAIIAAMLNGGSQYDMEPAWEALRQLKSRVVSLEANPAVLSELLKSGEAQIVMRTSYLFKPYIEQKYPISLALNLQEGLFGTPAGGAIIKGGPGKKEVAEAFINETLDAQAQVGMAEGLWFGPTNRNVTLKPEIGKMVIGTPEQRDLLIPVNLDNLAAKREEWMDKYTKALA